MTANCCRTLPPSIVSDAVAEGTKVLAEGRPRAVVDVRPRRHCRRCRGYRPGTVEVQVERVAPVTLALRAAGQLLAAPRSTFHIPEPAR